MASTDRTCSGYCLQQAQALVRLAGSSKSPAHRLAFQRMANRWAEVAECCDGKRHPGPSGATTLCPIRSRLLRLRPTRLDRSDRSWCRRRGTDWLRATTKPKRLKRQTLLRGQIPGRSDAKVTAAPAEARNVKLSARQRLPRT